MNRKVGKIAIILFKLAKNELKFSLNFNFFSKAAFIYVIEFYIVAVLKMDKSFDPFEFQKQTTNGCLYVI